MKPTSFVNTPDYKAKRALQLRAVLHLRHASHSVLSAFEIVSERCKLKASDTLRVQLWVWHLTYAARATFR